MPGTDGPGQFPSAQTHRHLPCPGRARRPGHLSPGPKADSEISGVCRSLGELFFLLPHTPTHTVSESPNVPEVDTFPLLAGKNMQMLAFTLEHKEQTARSAQLEAPGSGDSFWE